MVRIPKKKKNIKPKEYKYYAKNYLRHCVIFNKKDIDDMSLMKQLIHIVNTESITISDAYKKLIKMFDIFLISNELKFKNMDIIYNKINRIDPDEVSE